MTRVVIINPVGGHEQGTAVDYDPHTAEWLAERGYVATVDEPELSAPATEPPPAPRRKRAGAPPPITEGDDRSGG
ncbi:hypothetical protein Val02_69030 [Virgisporangium aliadipatigenens]|uniref:Uncharacterized protein n=1 Tax=Virgisporangium aliadipatigenens TaxID=741659 RepID=A0A8J3YT64_9ACTN|nr:hypothetical protein Val02_69030 [Virgisporangium aliadipatigenens]